MCSGVVVDDKGVWISNFVIKYHNENEKKVAKVFFFLYIGESVEHKHRGQKSRDILPLFKGEVVANTVEFVMNCDW